jgi:arabinose-5-phosphate isomerase
MDSEPKAKPRGPLEQLAEDVLGAAAEALTSVARSLPERLVPFAQRIASIEGHLVVAGMGKARFVAEKLSATFASLGTPSFALHPADAVHGDLGRITRRELVLVLSHSGETEEILRMLGPCRDRGAAVLAITGSKDSTLGRFADAIIEVGCWGEAGNHLAPTTSTTVMMSVGDALALMVAELRGLSPEAFKSVHPAGSIGRRLLRVAEIMRTEDRVPIARRTADLREVISVMTQTPGRPGAALVVGPDDRLVGIFTDGDLRRLLETNRFEAECPVHMVMGGEPRHVRPDTLVIEACRLMNEYRVDQLPVVDAERRPVGLLDVQDLLARGLLVPEDRE